jgi:hypothetical protein
LEKLSSQNRDRLLEEVVRTQLKQTPKHLKQKYVYGLRPLTAWKRYYNSGSRWKELQSLIGSDEILLYDNFATRVFTKGTPLSTLDIPAIVAYGRDEEFARLKDLLVSSHSWVTRTCLRLKGLLSMILEAEEASTDNWARVDRLARKIQNLVTNVLFELSPDRS